MKRLFLIILLLSLPIQAAWSAMNAYCQHEQGNAAKHFGHHTHDHQPQKDDDKKSGPLTKVDRDCAYCHVSQIGAFRYSFAIPSVITPSLHASTEGQLFSFLPPERPERPKWNIAA